MSTIKISSVATSFAHSVLILVSLCRPAMAQSTPSPALSDRDAALAVVQAFFDTLAAKDVAGAQRILITKATKDVAGEQRLLRPEATFHYVQQKDGKTVVEGFTRQWWLEAMPGRKQVWFERIWNPEVRVHGLIATVWAPYDLWRDGTFSHCGVDACSLIKTDEGWQISGCIYTIEKQCEASPLGPPSFKPAASPPSKPPSPQSPQ